MLLVCLGIGTEQGQKACKEQKGTENYYASRRERIGDVSRVNVCEETECERERNSVLKHEEGRTIERLDEKRLGHQQILTQEREKISWKAVSSKVTRCFWDGTASRINGFLE